MAIARGGRLLVLSALALHGAAAFSVGAGSGLRWPVPRARACASGRGAGIAALRAEADTARKFRGPGNPNAAELQTPTYGDDLIDDVLGKRFGAGQAFYGEKQSSKQKDYDAIKEEVKQIMAIREVREDATLIIGACRVLGSVAQWTTIKAMQKEVPIRILAADFEAAQKTFGTDGANLDIFFGDTNNLDQLDNACDGAKTIVYADEGSLPFGGDSYDARHRTGLERLLQVAPKYSSVKRIIYVSSAVSKGLGGGASKAMWAAEELLRASGIPYVIVRAGEMRAEPGGTAKIEVASAYAPAIPAGASTTAMDVADTVVTCLVMEEILAKAVARAGGGALPNLPRVKDQLTIDVWNNAFEPAPADQFTALVKSIATLPADGQ